ncbi:MAG: exopolysaccharide biosynthesis polyprenyl glycosylphosphotransferase [Acidobacteriia bacterium]|nr:exopolysaccharide biosynthesis polyprenyl glycosylphosphotransferase [Terriglobia bacterium]
MLRLLIVGTTALTDRLIAAVEAGAPDRYRVIGVVSERTAATAMDQRYPVLGTLADLDRLVDSLQPGVIAIAMAERRGSLPVRELLEYRVTRGIAVEDGVEMYERLTGAVAVDTLTPSSLVFSGRLQVSRSYLAWTRAMGIALSLAGLVALSPLLLLIALAIALDSRGPILFAQPRIGRAGRPFTLLKFRTMRDGGHGSEWVRDNGDRITRVGKWLRKFRLDELPQLVNVLRGDMNLVGPRPHPVTNFETLRLLSRNLNDATGVDIPYYTLRTLVRPGITGWAQIRYGYANDFDEEIEKLRYDLYYITHLSFGLDLRILIETARVVLRGQDSGPVVAGAARAANVTGRTAA